MRLALFALLGFSLLAAACGQDVESCGTACAIVRPTSGAYGGFQRGGSSNPTTNACTEECEADEATAIDAGREGYFQELLTCIGNAQSFPSACYPAACEAHTTFVLPTNGCAAVDGGS